MSISSDLTRIQNAKSSLATSITNKGVTVPSGTKIDGFAALVDQISSGGGSGLEYEKGTWQPATDTTRGTITFSNTHTIAPAYFAIVDATGNLNVATYSCLFLGFCDVYRIFGVGFFYSSTEYRYAVANYSYRGSSTTSNSTVLCSYNSDDPGSNSTSYPKYWATSTEFHPYSNSNSRYWRAGRTYKWIAIWV